MSEFELETESNNAFVPKIFNEEAAAEFLKEVPDPIVVRLIQHLYMNFVLSKHRPEQSIDMLFVFKCLDEGLRDKEYISQVMRGEVPGIAAWSD